MVHSNRRQDGLVSPKVGVAYPHPPPPPPPPRGRAMLAYIRNLIFQSSSFTLLDRSFLRWTALVLRFVYTAISVARVARCAIQHSVSYCVKLHPRCNELDLGGVR